MALVGTIAANLSAGTAAFEAGMNKASSIAKKFGDDIGKRLTFNIDVLSIANKLKEITVAGFESGVALAALSDQLQMDVGKLQAWQLAADYAEVSQDDLSNALLRLSKNIGAATLGSGELVESFAQLGLNANELSKMPVDQAMAKVADAIAGLENKYHQANLAAEVFGRGGVKLMNLLRGASEEIKRAEKDVGELTGKFTEFNKIKFQTLDDQFDKLLFKTKQIGMQAALTAAEIAKIAGKGLLSGIIGAGVVQKMEADQKAIAAMEAAAKAAQPKPAPTKPIDTGFAAAMKDGAKVLEGMLSPAEKLNKEIDGLFHLVMEGALSWQEYDKAVTKAREDSGPGKTIKDLQQQVDLIGASAKQMDLYKAKVEGAHAVELAQIGALHDRLAVSKKFTVDPAKDLGHALEKEMLSPLDKFEERLTELGDLAEFEIIKPEQFAEALGVAAEELRKAMDFDETGPAAKTKGSQAAFSAIDQFNRRGENQKDVKTLIQQAKEQTTIQKKLATDIGKQVAAQFGIQGI